MCVHNNHDKILFKKIACQEIGKRESQAVSKGERWTLKKLEKSLLDFFSPLDPRIQVKIEVDKENGLWVKKKKCQWEFQKQSIHTHTHTHTHTHSYTYTYIHTTEKI